MQRLQIWKIPKFSIAIGNWVGELPPDLRKMSYGSLSLKRPVQSYGRIANFSGTSGPGGSCLKGDVYSNRLDTAFVTKTVPIIPGQSPVCVLVVSPFTNDASALNKGKIAATKTDYIIEPVKITVEKNTAMNDKQMCNPSLIDSEIDFSYLGKNFTMKTSPSRKNELWNQSELQNTKSNVNYFPCFKLLLNAEPNVINLIYTKM
jgi:hypothetical protein